jgi:hypothetical protein
MVYTFRFTCGPYASHAYISKNIDGIETEIFTFQLDYGCSDGTHFDYYYKNIWYSVKDNLTNLDDDVKKLFILGANHTLEKLDGYSGCSDTALNDLKNLMQKS